MRGSTLDEIDLKLLSLLQDDGRISQHDLSEAVGLSSPATGERLRKLEECGIIKGFTAILNAKLLGHDVTAFIAVSVDGSQHFPNFVERSRWHPEIQECHTITGQGSHLLKIQTRDTSTLERLLAEIQSWPGVHGTTTSVVLSVLKETNHVPMIGAESEE